MREGINPEKSTGKLLQHASHRIILPVYIPSSGEYHAQSLDVLKLCLQSLMASIDSSVSKITVIDNDSRADVNEYLQALSHEKKIDRLVSQVENRGKVEPVIREAVSANEPFITISDADTFFYPGWIQATVDIFKNFERVSVVSPIPEPHLYLYCNYPCFLNNFFTLRLRKGRVVDESAMREFYQQINFDQKKPVEFERSLKRQFYLETNRIKAILGATHQVATYKKELFVGANTRVLEVFGKGVEKKYMDVLNLKNGSWRVATSRHYADHIGNIISKPYAITEDVSDKSFPVQSKKFGKPAVENKMLIRLSAAISKWWA